MKIAAVLVLAAGQMWAQAARPYMISTFAGKGRAAFQEGASPSSVQLFRPQRIAEDVYGNLYLSDSYYHRVFRISPAGTVTTLAGTGEPGYNGDGIAANKAQLNSPCGVQVDAAGDVYIADMANNRVRMVTPAGVISTIAGTGVAQSSGDGGTAVKAGVSLPKDVAVDVDGTVYIAESGVGRVRRVKPDGSISSVDVSSLQLPLPTPTSITVPTSLERAPFGADPSGVALDNAGNLYVTYSYRHIVWKLPLRGGAGSVVAGTGVAGYNGDNIPGKTAMLRNPESVAVDPHGNVYIADTGNSRLRKVAPDGTITSAAGNGIWGWSGDGGECQKAQLGAPTGLVIDDMLNLYVVDSGERRVRRLYTGNIYNAAGSGAPKQIGDGAQARAALLQHPSGVALDAAGNLYISDREDNRIRKVAGDGVITSAAGDGSYATLPAPGSLAVDALRNIYVAVPYGVRKIDPAGAITVYAGTGQPGDSGDGGPAAAAQLGGELKLALDASGNLFISDAEHNRVRKVSASGIITTAAGDGTPGKLSSPGGIAADAKGNLLIAEWGSGRVRKLGTEGTLATITDKLGLVSAVAVDAAGNLLCADAYSVYRVAPDGSMKRLAGGGGAGFAGDYGPADGASLNGIEAIAVDLQGNMYVADAGNMRVRKIEQVQIFSTSIVNAASYSGGTIAPGEIVTIFGVDFGPAALSTMTLNSAGLVDSRVAETRVFFDSIAAPVVYAVSGQVSAIVPYGLNGKTSTQLRVEYKGNSTNAVPVTVAPSAPGIFSMGGTGRGQGAILNQDNTINSAGNAAARGSVVQVFGTGEGQTSPAGVDGRVNKSATLPKPVLQVTVTVDGMPATVTYAGAAPNAVSGVLQVNVRIPDGVRTGSVPIAIKIGANASQDGVTVVVK